MTKQTLVETQGARQVPIKRMDGQLNPTPVEIRIAIWDALIADAADPQTPPIPAHAMGLIRRAITKANEGRYQ